MLATEMVSLSIIHILFFTLNQGHPIRHLCLATDYIFTNDKMQQTHIIEQCEITKAVVVVQNK